jgi:hypothetical protein
MRKTSSSMLKTTLIVCMCGVGKSLSIFTYQISSEAGDGFEILFRQNNPCEASCRTTSIRCFVHREQCLDESCAGLLSTTWSNQSAWSDWSVGQINAYEPSCRTTSVCCYVHREQSLDVSCAGLLSKKLSNQSVWSDWSGMLTKEFEFSPTNNWGFLCISSVCGTKVNSNSLTTVCGSCVEFVVTLNCTSCLMLNGSFSFLDETLFNRSSLARWLI